MGPAGRTSSRRRKVHRSLRELEDCNRVAARVELGPQVAVADVDERGGERVGHFGDEDLRGGEVPCEIEVCGHDAHVGEEREGRAVRGAGDHLGGERGGFLVNGEENAIYVSCDEVSNK